MISCYYDIVLRKRKGWKNIMKKQFKVLARLVTTAVMAAALSGCSSQGAGKKKTPEKKISLSEKAKTLTEGESFTLMVKNGSEKMDAKSKNPSIAALEKVAKTKADYKVTAVKAGETEIVFKKDSKTYSCKVTVNAKPVSVDKTTVQSSQNKVSQSQPSNTNNGTSTGSSTQASGSSSHNAAISKSQSKNSVQSSNTPRKTNTPSNASRNRSNASSNRRTPSTQSSQNNNARQSQSKSGRSSGSSGNSVTTRETKRTYNNPSDPEHSGYVSDYEGFSGHDDWTAIDDND
ncbi:hypothetical protein SAMN04487834_101527 [Sharpea azabuensis]|uniref:Ig-like domain (Group 2) n=2 Tax=Sharpea azabuensis TaxID=322505 RepID=A0A1H6SHC7_9FIRM|nr:hypothetical protein SAMN04487834_101527 [Sharpea azabuensis]